MVGSSWVLGPVWGDGLTPDMHTAEICFPVLNAALERLGSLQLLISFRLSGLEEGADDFRCFHAQRRVDL